MWKPEGVTALAVSLWFLSPVWAAPPISSADGGATAIKTVEKSSGNVTPPAIGAAAAAPLSPEEQKIKIDQASQEIEHLRRQIADRLEQARDKKEIIPINCLYEKLNQAEGLKRLAKTADGAFRKALQQKQEKDRNYHFQKVSYLQQKVEELERESRLCQSGAAGETRVKTLEGGVKEIDPGKGNGDEDEPQIETPVIPPASPYR